MAIGTPPLEVEIRRAIEVRARQIAEEELARAQETVSIRLREEMAKIVLACHAMYRIEFDQKHIIITVENKTSL